MNKKEEKFKSYSQLANFAMEKSNGSIGIIINDCGFSSLLWDNTSLEDPMNFRGHLVYLDPMPDKCFKGMPLYPNDSQSDIGIILNRDDLYVIDAKNLEDSLSKGFMKSRHLTERYNLFKRIKIPVKELIKEYDHLITQYSHK